MSKHNTHTLKQFATANGQPPEPRYLPLSLQQQPPLTDVVLTAPLALYEPLTSLDPLFSFLTKLSRHNHRLSIVWSSSHRQPPRNGVSHHSWSHSIIFTPYQRQLRHHNHEVLSFFFFAI